MGKVEPQTIRAHIGARLIYVRSQNLTQRRLKQMRRGMVPGAGRASFSVQLDLDGVSLFQEPFGHLTQVIYGSIRQLAGCGDFHFPQRSRQNSDIADLTAALGIKRRHIQNNRHLFAIPGLGHNPAFAEHADDGSNARRIINSQLVNAQSRQIGNHNSRRFFLPRRPGSFPLFGHCLVESSLVQFQTLLGQNFIRQFPRETKCVI